MHRTAFTAIAILALTLTGCASQTPPPGAEPDNTPAVEAPAEPTVSAACSDSLAELETVDAGAEDAAIIASMAACSTVDEYIAGVTANPASWLLTGPEFVDRDTILAAGCSLDDSTAVCEDARELGYID